jgi:hypothetical protein
VGGGGDGVGVAEGPALTVGLAGAAGVASAVVSCPAELVMLHQQTSGAKMVPAVRQLVATHGPLSLWRGMAPTMMRECLWVGAYLGSVPVLEEGLRSTEVRVIGGLISVWRTPLVVRWV